MEVRGSPASLAATLFAHYADIALVACKPDVEEDFAIPNGTDLLAYGVRNVEAEREALGADELRNPWES